MFIEVFVRPHEANRLPLDGFSWNIVLNIFRKFIGYNQVSLKSYKINCSFMIICRSVLLRMRNVLDKICTKNQNTFYFQQHHFFFRKSCCLWDNVEKYCAAGQAAADNIERRTRIACRMSKVTDTHSKHVIPPSFPRQIFLWEIVLILRLCTCNVCSSLLETFRLGLGTN